LKKEEARQWAEMLSVGEADEVPEGWRTAKEIAEQTSTSYSRTMKKLNELLDSGEVETKKFRRKAHHRIYPCPHFRYVRKGKN
tara:strand:+ start:597 stop:845 length:249 start_codon:yes stop_codon:yes gene_type:complete